MKDVDEVPFPAYHLWDIPRYMKLMINPGVTLITSRGCPYACTFCDAEMTPRQYRAMNPKRTVDLIEHILRTYNPPQLVLFDDLFTIQRKRVIEVCKEIIARDLFFEWVCESRVDTMDFEMLRWLRKAGCVKIYYGLESGSPRMLVTMKKGVTPEKVLHGAKLNRQLGMYFKFFILYGFPEDTVEDHRLTEELIAETRPDAVCCAILQPIPGTAVYEQLKPYLTKDVAEMDFHYWHSTESFKHPTFTPPGAPRGARAPARRARQGDQGHHPAPAPQVRAPRDDDPAPRGLLRPARDPLASQALLEARRHLRLGLDPDATPRPAGAAGADGQRRLTLDVRRFQAGLFRNGPGSNKAKAA